jgi:hypothetical protein
MAQMVMKRLLAALKPQLSQLLNEELALVMHCMARTGTNPSRIVQALQQVSTPSVLPGAVKQLTSFATGNLPDVTTGKPCSLRM